MRRSTATQSMRVPVWAWGAAALVVVAACGRREEPSFPEEPRVPEFAPLDAGPRGAEAPPEKLPLRWVTGPDGVPEELLEKWPGPGDLRVEKVVWALGEAPPPDGDLYVVSADRLEALRRVGALYDWTGGAESESIHPMFLGHAFDPHNAEVLPWRWSPWVFFYRQNDGEPRPETGSWTALPARQGLCWPREPGVVAAMRRKAAGHSANVVRDGEPAPEWNEDYFAGRDGCWERLRNGSAQAVLLPAYYGLRPEGFPAGVEWAVPQRGTLLEIEHLAVRAGCLYEAEAVWLAVWLLQVAQQQALVDTCGWLPVRVPLGREMRDSPRAITPTGWLDHSEVLWLEAGPLPGGPPEGNATAVAAEAEPAAPADGAMEPVFAPTALP